MPREIIWFCAVCVVVFLGSSGLIYAQFYRGECMTPSKSEPSALALVRDRPLPSREVILRAVYLDPRSRDGFPNISVFLAEIHKELLVSGEEYGITGCGTSTVVSTHLTVRVAIESAWPHKKFPKLTHDVAMIDCFGLPMIPSGTRAFLWYRLKGSKHLYRVESERPYFVPHPKQAKKDGDDIKVVVCLATVCKFPPFIAEFLRYYKYLGVDHVYMVAEESFVRNGVIEAHESIQEALREGFVSFSFWHQWLRSDEVFYHSQYLGYADCIYRFQGTYDYAFLVDSDDHFIPLLPQQKILKPYIKRNCKIGACTFKWIEYYPDCGQDWSRLGPNGNITNTLLSYTCLRKREGKSLYRLAAVLDAGVHSPNKLLTGYKRKIVPPNEAYVAHVRKNRDPPKGLNFCNT